MKASLALVILLLASSAFAQGAAPFWEPLPGPYWSGVSTMLPDSSIGTMAGGTTYIYVPNSRRWVPTPDPENTSRAALEPAPHYGYVYIFRDDTLYARFRDTVYFSSNDGSSWAIVGAFGEDGSALAIRNIIELRSGYLVIQNDSNTFFGSADKFLTVDTEHAPEFPESSWGTGDSLWVSGNLGDIFLSSDHGKNWKLVYSIHAPAPTELVTIEYGPRVWLIQAYHYDTASFPHAFQLLCSTNFGNLWLPMSVPFDTSQESSTIIQPFFVGADTIGHIYLDANDTSYRTQDYGKSWTPLSHLVQYVMRDGTLYSGNLISTDEGATWDSLGSAGVFALGRSMIATGDLLWASTTDGWSYGLAASLDNGLSWVNYPWSSEAGLSGFLYLSLRPDSGRILMGNTTERIFPPDGQDLFCNYRRAHLGDVLPIGLGVITSGFQIWVLPNTPALHDEVITESADTGCSFQIWDTITSTPVMGVTETLNDTILAVSSSQIVKGFESFFGQRLTFDTLEFDPYAYPTGAMVRDSTGAIYVAMSDGKLFVTDDGANSWSAFASPESDASAPIISMSASPNGLLFAVDSNLSTGYTRTWQYDPARAQWQNVTSGLKRPGFSDTAIVTNVWYVNGYAYAGTWNMGLFRSLKPVGPVSSVAAAEHTSPLKLYPNPALGTVTLTYPAYLKGSYRIDDVAGREVLRGALPSSGTVTIDLQSVPAGIYAITAGSGHWAPVKLVVEH